MEGCKQPPSVIRMILTLLVVVVGSLFLLFSWSKLAPESAPGWLQAAVDAITPTPAIVAAGEPIEIAVAADQPYDEGRSASIAKAVQMAFDEINARGGIGGRPLQARIYDDHSEAERAEDVVRQIASSNAVAVIGHRISTMSAAAGPAYEDAKIPVITPTSTSPIVTKGNPWYFRMLGTDDRTGRFLAHYVNTVVRPQKTVIVTESNVYGDGLSQSFLDAATEIGMATMPVVRIAPEAETREVTASLIESLEAEEGAVTVYFAMYPERAVPMIRAIRDREIQDITIVAPDAFLNDDFINSFNDLPREQRMPGFYTDDITLAAPLVYDVAGQAAGMFFDRYSGTFGASPDWRAAFAYDAAQLVAAAIEAAIDVEVGKAEQAVEDVHATVSLRAEIKEQLGQFRSPFTAHQGVTGPVFFDSEGDSQTTPSIARLESHQLVAALNQFKVAQTLTREVTLEQMMEEGRVIDLDGVLMERANVIHTGVTFDEVGNVDTDTSTAMIQGAIWFRYDPVFVGRTSGIDPTDIVFLNAADEITTRKAVQETTRSGTTYQRIDFSGRFNIDFVPSVRRFGEPTVGISFRHAQEPTSTLLYVVDLVGMGLIGGRSFVDQLEPVSMQLANAGWHVEGGAVYQGLRWTGALGDPAHLGSTTGKVPQSAFFAFSQLAPNAALGQVLLPKNQMIPVFLIAGMVLIVTILWRMLLERKTGAFLPLATQCVSLFLVLWLGERILFRVLEDGLPFQQLGQLSKLFDMLSWLVPAYYLASFLHDVVWRGIEQRTGRLVPKLIKGGDKVVIYLLAIMGVLASVFDQPITNLLATTGLVGLIIGFAMQSNLSNIFSGLVLSIERPFTVGDVVEVAGMEKMRVEDMTWRSVRLGVGTSKQVAIPNANVAGSIVANHTRSTPANQSFEMRLPVGIPPEEVLETIKSCMAEIDTILHDAGYDARFRGLFIDENQWYESYFVLWKSEEPEKEHLVTDRLWRMVWERIGDRIADDATRPRIKRRLADLGVAPAANNG